MSILHRLWLVGLPDSPPISVVAIRRHHDIPHRRLFTVREFDTKLLRQAAAAAARQGPCTSSSPISIGKGGKLKHKDREKDRADRAEQAARATIRQVMLEQHLGSIPATRPEIQALKRQQTIGKRAPSAALLSGADMLRLLLAFKQYATARALRGALVQLAVENPMPTVASTFQGITIKAIPDSLGVARINDEDPAHLPVVPDDAPEEEVSVASQLLAFTGEVAPGSATASALQTPLQLSAAAMAASAAAVAAAAISANGGLVAVSSTPMTAAAAAMPTLPSLPSLSSFSVSPDAVIPVDAVAPAASSSSSSSSNIPSPTFVGTPMPMNGTIAAAGSIATAAVTAALKILPADYLGEVPNEPVTSPSASRSPTNLYAIPRPNNSWNTSPGRRTFSDPSITGFQSMDQTAATNTGDVALESPGFTRPVRHRTRSPRVSASVLRQQQQSAAAAAANGTPTDNHTRAHDTPTMDRRRRRLSMGGGASPVPTTGTPMKREPGADPVLQLASLASAIVAASSSPSLVPSLSALSPAHSSMSSLRTRSPSMSLLKREPLPASPKAPLSPRAGTTAGAGVLSPRRTLSLPVRRHDHLGAYVDGRIAVLTSQMAASRASTAHINHQVHTITGTYDDESEVLTQTIDDDTTHVGLLSSSGSSSSGLTASLSSSSFLKRSISLPTAPPSPLHTTGSMGSSSIIDMISHNSPMASKLLPGLSPLSKTMSNGMLSHSNSNPLSMTSSNSLLNVGLSPRREPLVITGTSMLTPSAWSTNLSNMTAARNKRTRSDVSDDDSSSSSSSTGTDGPRVTQRARTSSFSSATMPSAVVAMTTALLTPSIVASPSSSSSTSSPSAASSFTPVSIMAQ